MRLRLSSAAELDYSQTVQWLERQQVGLGAQFDKELSESFEQILVDPERFPRATRSVRKAVMPRFKYGVFFITKRDEIEILAIYHPSRDPAALRRRFA